MEYWPCFQRLSIVLPWPVPKVFANSSLMVWAQSLQMHRTSFWKPSKPETSKETKTTLCRALALWPRSAAQRRFCRSCALATSHGAPCWPHHRYHSPKVRNHQIAGTACAPLFWVWSSCRGCETCRPYRRQC